MSCWLMKAEPDSRIVKGKDVKFSVNDLKAMGTSQWDGVRSHEAKKIMKEKMKVGDKVLFYHSNTKIPGVFGLAHVSREGYPDYTAWDPTHPYHDPKSTESQPTWFMVDVTYDSHLPHPPTLNLLKTLATAATLPSCVSYIGQEGWKEIKEMALINRGRLSVQPVTDGAYDAVVKLGMEGGWEELVASKSKAKAKGSDKANGRRNGRVDEEGESGVNGLDRAHGVKANGKKKSEDKSRAGNPNKDGVEEDDESSLSSAPSATSSGRADPVKAVTSPKAGPRSKRQPGEAVETAKDEQGGGEDKEMIGSRRSKRLRC